MSHRCLGMAQVRQHIACNMATKSTALQEGAGRLPPAKLLECRVCTVPARCRMQGPPILYTATPTQLSPGASFVILTSPQHPWLTHLETWRPVGALPMCHCTTATIICYFSNVPIQHLSIITAAHVADHCCCCCAAARTPPYPAHSLAHHALAKFCSVSNTPGSRSMPCGW
jgi:hypothetical protein